ncbi:ArsA family ATPase [Alcanivorax hongdengensis]|nr:ArsA family ATPase [Alcanivorax hongdengensis]
MLDIDALLLHKRLLMVGGKGGVGKTTSASALAVRAASLGRDVLLISTDPAHSLADAFERPIGGEAVQLAANLSALELDPEQEVDAYLDRVSAQMRRFAGPDQVHALEKQLRLNRQAPGAQEAALLERLAHLMEDGLLRHDLLIFDTAPTGHTLRLLSLPEVMAAWTDGLLRHNDRARKLGQVLNHLTPGKDLDSPLQDPGEHAGADLDPRSRELADTLLKRQRLFHRTRRLLCDSERSAFLFVLTAEKLPILETRRAVDALRENHIPVAGALVNRLLPDAADGDFLAKRRRQQDKYLAEIEQVLGKLPRRPVPLQEEDVQGLAALERFGEIIGGGKRV